MLLISIAILFTTIHIASSETLSNCSALQAFVGVRGLGITNNTITSAQALFAPHSYYTPWTALVLITEEDDICNPFTSFTTDITDKIALLFEDIGDCSVHYKVLVAETNGAIAVLMSNTDLTGTVITIIDDDDLSGIDPTIPMRSISKQDANILSAELQAERGVEIEFGCFDTEYSTELCLTDASEWDWTHLAGNYQRQEQESVNGHPIWKNPGQKEYRQHSYIYLHDAHGDDEWFWAITWDETFQYDSSIKAICGTKGAAVPDPSLCPGWQISYNGGETWNPVTDINVTEGLCTVPVDDPLITMCVDSQQYRIGGLRGTYTLTATGTPMWWRDMSDCDERSGQLIYVSQGYYGTGFFVVWDPGMRWIISLCIIDESNTDNGTFASSKWRPDLCADWVTRNDYDFAYSDSHRYPDATFNVSTGACSTERASVHSPPCVDSEAPETLCLTNNSIIHGWIMGEYSFLPSNETGPYYDSPIYQRIDYYDPFNPNDSTPLYLWYVNEYYAATYVEDYLWGTEWIITNWTLDEAIDSQSFSEYGHCSGWSYGNPAQCHGWTFYANKAMHYDEDMSVAEGKCDEDENPIPSLPDTWPEYICIGLINESLPYGGIFSSVDSNSIAKGAFYINRTLVDDDNPVPEWKKVHNDMEEDMLIWFSRHWYISTATGDPYSSTDPYANTYPFDTGICDPYSNADSMSPLDCKLWLDGDWNILDNIYLEECSADDVIIATPTTSPTPAPTNNPTGNAEICFSRNGTVSSWLEGIYMDNGLNRDEYGTVEFVQITSDINAPTLYIWYHDEGWWISNIDYKKKNETDESVIDVYGYCPGGERGMYPVCEDDWTFFWDDTGKTKTIEDASFVLSNDLSGCDNEADGVIIDEYMDTLCLNAVGTLHSHSHHEHVYNDLDSVPTERDLSTYVGEYIYVEGAADGFDSYYMHIESGELYLRHNRVSNHWYIGLDMLCQVPSGNTDVEEGIPSVCVAWDMTQHEAVYVDNLISFSEECIVYARKEKGKGGKVAGTVIGILLGIICCGVIIFLWVKFKKDKSHHLVVRGSIEQANEMVETMGGTKGVDTSVVPDNDEQQTLEALNARENEDD